MTFCGAIHKLFIFWAAKPGFPFVVVSCRLVFVGGTWASFLSLRPPTKTTAAITTSYHCNPCRRKTSPVVLYFLFGKKV